MPPFYKNAPNLFWGNPIWQYCLITTVLQNAFSAIANPDGCTWDEAEILLGKGNSFSAGYRFWAVPEAAGLKAFRKEATSRSLLSVLSVAILRQEQEAFDPAPK